MSFIIIYFLLQVIKLLVLACELLMMVCTVYIVIYGNSTGIYVMKVACKASEKQCHTFISCGTNIMCSVQITQKIRCTGAQNHAFVKQYVVLFRLAVLQINSVSVRG